MKWNLEEKVFVTVPRGRADINFDDLVFYSHSMQCCSFAFDAKYIYLFLYVRVSPRIVFALILRMEEFDSFIIVTFRKKD